MIYVCLNHAHSLFHHVDREIQYKFFLALLMTGMYILRNEFICAQRFKMLMFCTNFTLHFHSFFIAWGNFYFTILDDHKNAINRSTPKVLPPRPVEFSRETDCIWLINSASSTLPNPSSNPMSIWRKSQGTKARLAFHPNFPLPVQSSNLSEALAIPRIFKCPITFCQPKHG